VLHSSLPVPKLLAVLPRSVFKSIRTPTSKYAYSNKTVMRLRLLHYSTKQCA